MRELRERGERRQNRGIKEKRELGENGRGRMSKKKGGKREGGEGRGTWGTKGQDAHEGY